MPDEVIKLRRKITNYTNQNGQGAGWLSMLIYDVTERCTALGKCNLEQLQAVHDRLLIVFPKRRKGARPQQGDRA